MGEEKPQITGSSSDSDSHLDDKLAIGIADIKRGLAKLKKELPAYAAAKEILKLGIINAKEYADAVLDMNSYGGDVAEIDFCDYSNNDMNLCQLPVEELRAHDRAEFLAWVGEVRKVVEVVKKYGGTVTFHGSPNRDYEDGVYLDSYIKIVETNIETSRDIRYTRAHVKISLPRQGWCCPIKHIEDTIKEYERQ